MNPKAMSPRAKWRRRLQQRQTVIFGTLIAALLFAALFAWLTYRGAIPSPWTRDFTYPETLETSQEFVCPPEGAYTIELSDITANVYNSGSQVGLATTVAGKLRDAGVTVEDVGNWQELLVTAGQIQTGRQGVVAAYTLQQLFPGLEVMIDGREDSTVDVILGYLFTAIGSADGIEAGTAINTPEKCLPEETEPAGDVDEGEDPDTDDSADSEGDVQDA